MVGAIETVAVLQHQTHVGNELRYRLVYARFKLVSYWSHNTADTNQQSVK